MPKSNYLSILQTLDSRRVEFIVVGGVAAVLGGAPVNTFDLDIVHSRNPENVERLAGALEELDAHYRLPPEIRRRPEPSHLSSSGHQLLMTRYGPLDLLGMIGKDRTYADLLSHSMEMNVGEGLRVRVLDLETIISVKEELSGEKDLATLPVLRRTLAESRERR